MKDNKDIIYNEEKNELAPGSVEDAIVYLLIDVSGSMSGSNILMAKKGAKAFAFSAIEKGHHAGLISFGSFAEYLCDPTDSKEAISQKIGLLHVAGSTNMAEALRMAHKCFADIRPDLATVVLATDGIPDSVNDALREADILKSHGVTIITIGTDGADEIFLKQIASADDLVNVVENQQFEDAISKAADDLLMLDDPNNQ
jgi:Mg-chelatase subunit ChlD